MSVLKRIASDPRLAYYYSQKAVRSPLIRRWAGNAVAAMVGKGDFGGNIEASRSVAQELASDGLSFLPSLYLSKEKLNQIFQHFAGKPVVDLYDGKTTFLMEQTIPPSFSKLTYNTLDVLRCVPLMELANAPLILNAVALALGARPTIATVNALWTLGEHNAAGSQIGYDDIYHRDVDDWRFIKLFVYLTDTTRHSGAHCFVRKSHLNSQLTRRGPITNEQVAEVFPSHDVATIEGDAGTVFLENTWGVHRQLLATEGRRLIFSVLYSLCPWVPGRLSKLTVPLPHGLNPYVNRAFFASSGAVR
jgi:hypothetical protein